MRPSQAPSKNYISENRNKAIHELHPPAAQDLSKDDKHRNFGKVPQYINKYRHEENDRQEYMRRMEEEAKIPQGTRLMGEEERQQTLQDLH